MPPFLQSQPLFLSLALEKAPLCVAQQLLQGSIPVSCKRVLMEIPKADNFQLNQLELILGALLH